MGASLVAMVCLSLLLFFVVGVTAYLVFGGEEAK